MGISFGDAGKIRAHERDRALDVTEPHWPPRDSEIPGWDSSHPNTLKRIVEVEAPALNLPLEESILRFPSAPLHGLQRLHEHPVRIGPAETFHTYRVLQLSAEEADPEEPRVRRIYLMHCGLNERDTLELYYRLAGQLIQKERSAACIVRPFPGHLTRYPFEAYAETPLDRYLSDGSHLFRQFMRFMLETQWFLSVLARRSSYRCASGANLLSESSNPSNSRLNDVTLAKAMHAAWDGMHKSSSLALKDAAKDQPHAVTTDGPAPPKDLFEAAIGSLRQVLNLNHDYPGLSDEDEEREEPDVHVLGYSLGGFAAQSVFMSWPFLIASCSTLLAGGALRELAPTAFANPEEWQTVLHSLRYELDDRLMSFGLSSNTSSIAGIDTELFTHFKRTFYEVFQQEYRGAFQSRVKAFRQRMLFIVGGDDPVVQPRRVLESGPPGGMNLLEVGGLGHFFSQRPNGDREAEHQYSFWLPEMASLIDGVARGAAERQRQERPFTVWKQEMDKPLRPKSEWDKVFGGPGATSGGPPVRPLTPAELITIGPDGALPADLFERCLDDLLWRVATNEGDGVLFVLRNEVPSVMLPAHAVRERAAAMFHDDYDMVRYCHGIEARKQVLFEHRSRIGFVVPWNLPELTVSMDSNPGYPSQSEGAGGHVEKRIPISETWKEAVGLYEKHARGAGKASIRVFDGNPEFDGSSRVPEELIGAAKASARTDQLTRIATLPDIWFWVSRDFLTTVKSPPLTVELAVKDLLQVVPKALSSTKDLELWLRDGHLRIITVSRSRYNPRFRGRLVVDVKAARKTLVHAAMCIGLADVIAGPEIGSRLRRTTRRRMLP